VKRYCGIADGLKFSIAICLFLVSCNIPECQTCAKQGELTEEICEEDFDPSDVFNQFDYEGTLEIYEAMGYNCD